MDPDQMRRLFYLLAGDCRIFLFIRKGVNLRRFGRTEIAWEVPMDRDAATTDRLRNLISKIESRTESGELRWEKQAGSAHRYARWNNNLLILGPAAPLSDKSVSRYLFITPFDSPNCIEI